MEDLIAEVDSVVCELGHVVEHDRVGFAVRVLLLAEILLAILEGFVDVDVREGVRALAGGEVGFVGEKSCEGA